MASAGRFRSFKFEGEPFDGQGASLVVNANDMTIDTNTEILAEAAKSDGRVLGLSDLEPPLHHAIMKNETWPETVGDLPPLPSRSMRRIAKRSKHSSRGGVVVQLPGWARARIVFFESKLEQRALFILLARGDVVDLWEQAPCILYRNQAGLRRTHFPDFLIRLRSGRRIAVAVKPAMIAKKCDFVGTLRCIRQAITKDYADDLVLITDQDFTRAEALNAERFHAFSRSYDPVVFGNLRELISTTVFPTKVGEMAARLNAAGAGFRSIFVAIYQGLLIADRTTLIDIDTTIVAGGVQ